VTILHHPTIAGVSRVVDGDAVEAHIAQGWLLDGDAPEPDEAEAVDVEPDE
jgi:hypothetical protein